MDSMLYSVILLEEFVAWLEIQGEELQTRTLAHLALLKERGPLLSRPYADTLKGSSIPNLKELRFTVEKAPIRILFAFDPKQQAVIILGGNKQGDKRWYETNIPLAEKRFQDHLEKLRKIEIERARKEKQND